ncbi:hypothetical protein SAMN03080594_102365 [Arenibacter palladensis]|uniref:Secreted protein n=3 Tax=Arenibacter TaxID=178469 RepID=A0A1X7LGW6_9FLAO|nr:MULTISPECIES: DUF6520 family protein [Arenibacter]MBC8770545.1 hypothetical protein [Arenibacter arenosicollis]SHF02331.1 hypothetical protein SAMN03080594_102365 [Arenibacter palladensis]SMG53108.1 hypothetical protein SAMN03080602_04331 [Arenibacter troitsensis]
MKKLKLILPMLAFVFAIALSFAFANKSADKDIYDTKYILVQAPNGWATIDVLCNPDNSDCTVEFSEEPGTEYRVYDEKDTSKPTEGDGQIIELNGSAPDPD